jgi:hypothetical protein
LALQRSSRQPLHHLQRRQARRIDGRAGLNPATAFGQAAEVDRIEADLASLAASVPPMWPDPAIPMFMSITSFLKTYLRAFVSYPLGARR